MVLAFLSVLLPALALGQEGTELALPPSQDRIEVTGGMGVDYVRASDLVNLLNSTDGLMARVPDFKSAVEFFGFVDVPVTERWMVKIEYAYLLTSYTVATTVGSGVAEQTITAFLPSIIIQYVLVGAPLYNLKVGAGGGFHFGSVARKVYFEDESYSGKGPGFILELEGNTAVSEHLFASLGVSLRWEWIGALTSSEGTTPGGIPGISMHMFGPGARIGVGYLF
jgi:hypothetical protein